MAPCYFAISETDQERMHNFVSGELSRLVQLASGDSNDDGSTSRMVTAMLSGQVNEKLEPLRMTLDLSGADFREGAFGWRGFLYYKWAMQSFWPDVMGILREIKAIQPHGPVSAAQRDSLAAAKRSIIELVRDNSQHVYKVLDVYDESFAGLVAQQRAQDLPRLSAVARLTCSWSWARRSARFPISSASGAIAIPKASPP